jgi:hypothetical protein
MCNTYCFSTATVVTRTRLSVNFIRTLPVFVVAHPSIAGSVHCTVISLHSNYVPLHIPVSSVHFCQFIVTSQSIHLSFGLLFCVSSGSPYRNFHVYLFHDILLTCPNHRNRLSSVISVLPYIHSCCSGFILNLSSPSFPGGSLH